MNLFCFELWQPETQRETPKVFSCSWLLVLFCCLCAANISHDIATFCLFTCTCADTMEFIDNWDREACAPKGPTDHLHLFNSLSSTFFLNWRFVWVTHFVFYRVPPSLWTAMRKYRSCNVLVYSDKKSNRSEIWQASQQQCCWGACHIWEQCNHVNNWYHGCGTLRGPGLV